MYGVLYEKKLIALHDDLEIIQKFVGQQEEKQDLFDVIEIRKKNKTFQNNLDYQDLYLTRLGDSYVPFELYQTMKDSSDEYKYDLMYTRDVLFRILEDSELSEKESKAILKTISILMKEIEDSISIPYETLRDIKELNSQYTERIYDL